MRVLVTGAYGFIGQNVVVHLEEKSWSVLRLGRRDDPKSLPDIISKADAIIPLAGENRPNDPACFISGNVEFTQKICDGLRESGKKIPVIFASSIRAVENTPYGVSKLKAEELLRQLDAESGCNLYLYRLPNVFGKWSKPNYNSVVSTFCHNVANNLTISIDDSEIRLSLAYIDDVCCDFIRVLEQPTHISNHACRVPKFTT